MLPNTGPLCTWSPAGWDGRILISRTWTRSVAFTAGKRMSLTMVRVIGCSAEGSAVRPMPLILVIGRPAVRVVLRAWRPAGEGLPGRAGAEPVEGDGQQPGADVAFLVRVHGISGAAAELFDQPVDVQGGDACPEAAVLLGPGDYFRRGRQASLRRGAHLGGRLDLPRE